MNKTTTYLSQYNSNLEDDFFNDDMNFLNDLILLDHSIQNNTQIFLLNYSKTLFFIPNQSKEDLLTLT
tara:strand:+ start:723 stop:926 length:204 start_codon:yes stop_codon:yes gene_type:complete